MRLDKDVWRPGLLLAGVLLLGSTGAAPADAETRVHSQQPRYARFDEQLSTLIDRVLAGHPDSETWEHRAGALFERARGHRAWPESQVTYRWFPQGPETRVGPQRQSIALNQPLRSKHADEHAARSDISRSLAAKWRAESVRRALVADLKRSYFELAFVQEALEVNAEESALMRRYEQITLDRYANGEGNQVSVVKVQTDINRLAEKRLDLEQQRRRLIEQVVYLTTEPFDLAPIELRPVPEQGDVAPVLEAGLDDPSPALHSLTQTLAATEDDMQRVRSGRKPDWSVGLGWIDVGHRDDAAGLTNPPPDNGQDVFSLGFGVRFPADKRRIAAEQRELEGRYRAQRSELDSAEQRRAWAARDAWTRFDSLGERIELYSGAVVPQAERALTAAEAAYTTGRLAFLDLLDAQRVTFETRLALHRLRVDRWIAATDLEEALGQPFPTTDDKP